MIFIAGILTTALIFVLIGMLNQDNLTPQERRYQSCLETAYQGYGENKITLDSDEASAADRLSMKKYCLCISDTTTAEEALQKKIDAFVKEHNGTQPDATEYDVLAEEVASERKTFCNNQITKDNLYDKRGQFFLVCFSRAGWSHSDTEIWQKRILSDRRRVDDGENFARHYVVN